VAARAQLGRRLAALLVAGLALGALAASAEARRPACRHGVSSVGPVVLRGGHLSGDTHPHTQACLP